MERLTKRNSVGIAVYKHPYECERCNETIYRLPDYGNGSPTDRLCEYEYLEEQGRLLILPCAVGDTVYAIMIVGLEFGRLKYQVYEAKVVRHHIDSFHLCVEMITENGQRIELVAETFGETVFLTREEAEAALEKMKGEEHEK